MGEERLGIVYLGAALDETVVHVVIRADRAELAEGVRIVVNRHVAVCEVLQIV
jgi:hypothetical protein